MPNSEHGVDFITLIANRNLKTEIIELLLESKCHLIKVVYASGTLRTGYLRDMAGLVTEDNKVMITCLIAGNLTDKLLDRLIEKFEFHKPNTGIAFVVPVEKLSV